MRQTLHLCWVSLVALALVWGGVPPVAASPCEERESCCCTETEETPCSSPANDCGCHWEAPAAPVMPNEVFDPFSPPILHVAPTDAFRLLAAWETQQLSVPQSQAHALPPLWRRYQSFCVYLI